MWAPSSGYSRQTFLFSLESNKTHTTLRYRIVILHDIIIQMQHCWLQSRRHQEVTVYSQSHGGWHLRKLKDQSSNVSFHWNVAKETFELWALSFDKAFENDTPSVIGCACVCQCVCVHVWGTERKKVRANRREQERTWKRVGRRRRAGRERRRYLYVCIACLHVFVRVCICMSVCVCGYGYVYVYVCVCVCVVQCLCLCLCLCVSICLAVFMSVCACVFKQVRACMCVCLCVCLHVSVFAHVRVVLRCRYEWSYTSMIVWVAGRKSQACVCQRVCAFCVYVWRVRVSQCMCTCACTCACSGVCVAMCVCVCVYVCVCAYRRLGSGRIVSGTKRWYSKSCRRTPPGMRNCANSGNHVSVYVCVCVCVWCLCVCVCACVRVYQGKDEKWWIDEFCITCCRQGCIQR